MFRIPIISFFLVIGVLPPLFAQGGSSDDENWDFLGGSVDNSPERTEERESDSSEAWPEDTVADGQDAQDKQTSKEGEALPQPTRFLTASVRGGMTIIRPAASGAIPSSMPAEAGTISTAVLLTGNPVWDVRLNNSSDEEPEYLSTSCPGKGSFKEAFFNQLLASPSAQRRTPPHE